MGCFSFCSSKTSSSTTEPSTTTMSKTMSSHDEPRNIKHQTLVSIPQCRVHLVDGGEAAEIGGGEFTITRIFDDGVSLATIIRVVGAAAGDQLTWPLTKDEPVVRVAALSYLFTLPMSDGHPLSYGVSFPEQYGGGRLSALDEFLRENSCFSGLTDTAATAAAKGRGVDWKEFAPRVEDYNNVLARAIAGGTGQIVKGIFKCSNAYANQVQKGGQMTLSGGVDVRNGVPHSQGNGTNDPTNKTALNKSLKRVRNLSKMTEKLSKTMLDGVGIATGAVMGPVMKSQAGKSFLAMVPGEILLASLDAVNKILDAAEVAEKQALSATSTAATRMVSNRFGENAGEATADALATAGHCAGTAWNVFKIRKALNPASSVSTGVLKNAAKTSAKV